MPVGSLAGGKGGTSITFGEIAERYSFRRRARVVPESGFGMGMGSISCEERVEPATTNDTVGEICGCGNLITFGRHEYVVITFPGREGGKDSGSAAC